MPITGACMVPHPPIILPEVGRGEEKKISKTTESFQRVAEFVKELAPETIIISTPHSVMYRDYFHISQGDGARGDMVLFRAPEVRFDVQYDRELVGKICDLADKAGFPAGCEGEREKELDHGVMVPLYFINKEYRDYKLVRIGLSGLSLEDHFKMGELIKKATDETGRRVFYVASGDLSHKMKKEGPYGFDPAGPVYDERIMDVMGSGDFEKLKDFDLSFLEPAAECEHRSFCMMAGALKGSEVAPERLSHEDVFGVGYGVCKYEVKSKKTD